MMCRFLLLVAVTACAAPDPEEPPPDGDDTETDSDSVPDTDDTDSDTHTGDTGTTGLTFDCATIPTDMAGVRTVPNARAYHGLGFDSQDRLVGLDANNLIAVAFDGTFEVWAPNFGGGEQMAFLANGDLAVAAWNNTIQRVTPAGGVSNIANVGNVYGLVVGPDDMIYVADWAKVDRIDPANGQPTAIVPPGHSPKVVAFNHDGSKLYFGTIGNGGNVYSVDLDANYDPIGGPQLVGSTPGTWHDGLGVDVCGNVYVAEYGETALYRIGASSGGVQTLNDYPQSQYGHGLIWGSGSGGWDDHMLYVPQPYNGNTVAELDIGVPPAGWEGTVIGVSPF